jgi:hypothetical protein
VPELDPLMTEKLIAVGWDGWRSCSGARRRSRHGRNPAEVAAAVATHVQAFRAASLAPWPRLTGGRRARAAHPGAALGADHRASKRRRAAGRDRPRLQKQLRRRRERAFLQSVIVLARLGEVDLALRLDKLPFARRIEASSAIWRRPLARRPLEETDGAQRNRPHPPHPDRRRPEHGRAHT